MENTDLTESRPAPEAEWGHYGELRPAEIERIRAASSIAFVPWGALEWHCLHAPIGLDSTKAEGICVELARRCGGVVLPAIPFGVNTIKPYKGFKHSIDISAGLVSKAVEEICRQLADEGFRLVIVFTGHYPPEHLNALKEGAARAQADCPGSKFVVWADSQMLDKRFRADHAGATETSFQMLFAPGSVDLSVLPERALDLDGDGVMGDDPREASAERGKEQLESVLAAGAKKIEALLAEGGE